MTQTWNRAQYRPSGKVNWPPFLMWMCVTAAGAAAAAEGLNLLSHAGWYLFVLVPVLAAVCVFLILQTAIKHGRCRSPAVAIGAALILAPVVFLGHFYFSMITDAGAEYAGRIDLLPSYIDARMQSQVVEDVPSHNYPGHHERKPMPGLNWVWFGLDFSAILAVLVIAGRRVAARAYCEECGRWKDPGILLLPSNNGTAIARMLEYGTLKQLAGLNTPYGVSSQNYTAVLIEYCPSPSAGGCSAYLSVKDVTRGPPMGTYRRIEGGLGKVRVRQAELTPEEVAYLTPLFPRTPGKQAEIP